MHDIYTSYINELKQLTIIFNTKNIETYINKFIIYYSNQSPKQTHLDILGIIIRYIYNLKYDLKNGLKLDKYTKKSITNKTILFIIKTIVNHNDKTLITWFFDNCKEIYKNQKKVLEFYIDYISNTNFLYDKLLFILDYYTIDPIFSNTYIKICKTGNLEALKLLGKPSQWTLNESLWNVCKFGHLHICKYLIDLGANIHYQNDFCILTACIYNQKHIIIYLLNLGIHLNSSFNNIKLIEYAKFYKYNDIIIYLEEQ